ncbi:MAG: UDP-2,4-diacetamido-2,4,6-trideoxy-beta-L-altropyranose hydrolase [Helicobacteraceae bacterium]|nr:UDP-2,4-diacetamido-2,4,6-trideoxy-beta-L-altropyranose hydrolase [Helicobacteraceae bacterium]
MRVAIRVDSSVQIGYGHLSRTLNIARELRSRGSEVCFICRDLDLNGLHWIEAAGFRALVLPRPLTVFAPIDPNPKRLAWLGVALEEEIAQSKAALKKLGGADWLLVDSYALDYRYEKAAREFCRQIAVLDDLADRAHEADLLIDGAYMRDSGDYRSLFGGKPLCGAKYLPLNLDYGRYRALALPRRFPPKTILIAAGGIDAANLTSAALNAIAESRFSNAAIVAVLSARAPHIASNKRLSRELGLKVDWRLDASDIPLLILRADLGMGALGMGAYERACLALACVTIAAADNQRENLLRLSAAGAVIAEESFAKALEYLDEARVRACERAAFDICDGLGAARICDEMESAALR